MGGAARRELDARWVGRSVRRIVEIRGYPRSQNRGLGYPGLLGTTDADRSFQIWIRATIVVMVVIRFLMQVLEWMFFLGLAGSSIVVLISFWEDGKELFGED